MRSIAVTLLIISIIVSTRVIAADESFIRQWHGEEASRRSACENQGGNYDSATRSCNSSKGGSDWGDGLPAGHIYSQNMGSCTYDILVAYVPPDAAEYIVTGWWTTHPISSLYLTEGDEAIVVHNTEYPLYYYALKKKTVNRCVTFQKIEVFSLKASNMR